MQIQIDQHTMERAVERGTTVDEIKDVVETGIAIKAKFNRQGKVKIFNFNKKRNDKYYHQKRVEVYYIIENNVMITVTVYVFFGKWEN